MKKGRLPLTLAWGFVLLLLFVFVAMTVIAERSIPTLLLTYFFPPQLWAIVAVLLLLFSLKVRSWGAVAGSLVGLSITAFLQGGVPPHAVSGSPSFRLMTYNIARGTGGVPGLADTLHQQQPDVICLQEINGVHDPMFSDLTRQLPGYVVIQAREVAILSRLPVLRHQETPLPGTMRSLLSASLQTAAGEVTVLNAHFTTVPLRGGWAQAVESRTRQEQGFLQEAQTIPRALVACGDFNTPPRGLVYAALNRQFSNAFAQKGIGLGLTFPASFPLVRIDHVWLRQVEAVRAFVPASRASDHRPLVVDVHLP